MAEEYVSAAIKVELLELRRQFEKLTWLGGISVVLQIAILFSVM